MRVRQQLAPSLQETGMQVQTFQSFGFHRLVRARYAFRLLVTASFLDTPRQMDCLLDAIYNCYIHISGDSHVHRHRFRQ